MIFKKRCTKCLIPADYPGISFDSKGVCSYCLGTQHPVFLQNEKIRQLIGRKDKLKIDFENRLEDNKGKGEYDCLVGLSGGKDSCYLVYLLTNKYRLKVLAYSLENWIQRPTVKYNIKRAIAKLNIDHIFVTPKPEFFKIYYRYLLLSSQKEELEKIGYYGTVCHVCSKLLIGFAMKEAARRNIPLVLAGHSPDQIYIGFYEIPLEEIRRSWVPPWIYSKPDLEQYKKYFWDPDVDAKTDVFPQVLFPFHVLEYPSPDEVRKVVVGLGLMKKKDAMPRVIRSDCKLVSLLHYLGKKKGYDNALLSANSHRIRIGIESRRKSLILLTLSKFLVKAGIYRHCIRRREINFTLEFLNLKIKDLI